MRNLGGVIVCFILLVFSFPLMAQTEPTLVIPMQVPADAGGTVTVPVTYTANGNAISTIIFSVDFDETNLDFDPASTTGFPWPDAITVNPLINPFVFSVGITYDANDTDGELDFTFSDINPPLTALPEGDIATITFSVPTRPTSTVAAVNFSLDPPASFGSTTGESVPGITSDGSVLITVQCDPTGVPETICNGIDDDCDDSIDEDFTPEATTCGVGECAATGQTVCNSDGSTGDTCTPGTPTAEVCDDLDNDCDGSTDENLTRPSTCGVGECVGNTGEETCTAGTWGGDTCDPLAGAVTEGPPGDGTCGDTLDNDCDGLTDLADPGCEIVCTPTGVPETICNGIDDDCDNLIDEDFTPETTTCGVGECAAAGETSCVDGVEGDTCTPGTPSDEVCEGSLDENCDGVVDEGCDCTDGDTRSCGSDAGECTAGTENCVGGTWGGICVGEVGPSDEICDNLDNDCDGPVDEDLTRPTICGVGECAGNTGEETCTAGTWGGDTCDPLAGAVTEGPPGDQTCRDTLDNDCDGLTDLADPGCEIVCTPTGVPETVCNGIDDDCDGQVDEDFQTTSTTCGVGACDGSTGQLECQEGSEVDTCDPLAGAQPEGPSGDGTCSDTVDNDCDGQTDLGDIDCQANLELFDWGFYVDGITYCLLGPCDFDVDDIGNISGPEDLPSFIDTSGFDFTAGLGSISITLSDPGNHSVVMFVDHDIDEALNGFINETGIANGSPEMGQTWELDEPGGNFSGQNGSEGFPYFGDIFFDNFLDGLLDNRAFYDAIDDQTLTPPDDVSMAMGWDFELVEGQTATTVFLLSDTSIPQGFHLVHRDPDSDINIYFSSSLDRAQDVETDCFDGVDNDGDGLTDCADPDCEGATGGSCDTGQPGICSTGITTCQSEASVCVPDDEPELNDATCDGLDNDCDGQVDEDFQATPAACGAGVCARTGKIECVDGQEVDSCIPGPQDEPTDVTCDGRDGDCDGGVDEDFQATSTTCGVGVCEGNTGQLECQNGSEVDTCDPLAGAMPEGPAGNMTCNDGLDNDCDGLVDTDDTTCEMAGADVFLKKLIAPDSVKVKKGNTETRKITAFGMTDTIAQKATVNLTVNRIDAVTVNIHPESRTKSVRPNGNPKKFKFKADISCNETGKWTLRWEAKIDAPQNADTSNDTMTASTIVTCKKNLSGWYAQVMWWKIRTYLEDAGSSFGIIMWDSIKHFFTD